MCDRTPGRRASHELRLMPVEGETAHRGDVHCHVDVSYQFHNKHIVYTLFITPSTTNVHLVHLTLATSEEPILQDVYEDLGKESSCTGSLLRTGVDSKMARSGNLTHAFYILMRWITLI